MHRFIYKWLLLLSFSLVCFGTNDIIVSDVQLPEENTKITDDFSIGASKEPFIPTNEWQVVKEDQAIPAGLHIRMNFQTGIKEAKLLEENKTNENKNQGKKSPSIVLGEEISTVDPEKIKNSKEKLYFTKAHLKEALKDFRDKVGTKDIVDDITWSDDAKEALQETDEEDKERVRKKFRSMKEIRSELEDKMGWSIKSDVEIMKELVELLFDDNKSVDVKIAALDGLEDYVHQIDNARDLDRIGGMEMVVNLLNDTNELLQEKAANVVGAAAQNNKPAQDAVLSHHGLKFLLRMLDQEKSALSKKKGLFALSALVRGNYAAQHEFQTLNGIEKVISIVNDMNAGAARLKGIMLITDLIIEQNDVPDNDDKNQVDRPDWSKSLIENNWCNILKSLLDITGDYDIKEKVLQAVETSTELCLNIFQNNNIVQKLNKQGKLLKNEIETEMDEDFKSYLDGLLIQMISISKKIDS